MRPTLIILLAMAAILLMIWAFKGRDSGPEPVEFEEGPEIVGEVAPPPSYLNDPPEGGIPTEPAVITVEHDVVQVGPQHRLVMYFTEEHGWWVDGIYVRFWYRSKDSDAGDWVDYAPRNEFIPKAIPFGETMKHDFVIYETDLPQGMPKGTAENWHVEILKWAQDRVRTPPES